MSDGDENYYPGLLGTGISNDILIFSKNTVQESTHNKQQLDVIIGMYLLIFFCFISSEQSLNLTNYVCLLYWVHCQTLYSFVISILNLFVSIKIYFMSILLHKSIHCVEMYDEQYACTYC